MALKLFVQPRPRNCTMKPDNSRSRRRHKLPTTIEAERARVRALPAVRFLTGRFALPLATAVLTAEACGLHTGGDR